jgi:hypothetical protein
VKTKLKGIPVLLGGVTFIVPPLNFKSLKELQARIAAYNGAMDEEAMTLVSDVLKASLLRNYTEEQIGDLDDVLDVGNMADVMDACMDASGLKRKELETNGIATQDDGNPSTGTTSTAS